jgi:hypothetical protein
MALSTLVLASSLTTGLIILAVVFVVVVGGGLIAHRAMAAAKLRTRGDRTSEGGEQPPGRVGRL